MELKTWMVWSDRFVFFALFGFLTPFDYPSHLHLRRVNCRQRESQTFSSDPVLACVAKESISFRAILLMVLRVPKTFKTRRFETQELLQQVFFQFGVYRRTQGNFCQFLRYKRVMISSQLSVHSRMPSVAAKLCTVL